MATVTTLRPSATSSGVGWTPSTGTLHGVTSDDSDATYATWSGSGSALILATPVASPPVGQRRHQVRLRARGEDGDAWWSVRLASGALVAGASAQFPSSPSTVTGSWGFGAPPDGASILSTYVTGQSAGLKIEELYLDVDTREAPDFTPEMLDGSGTSTTTIGDTAQPTVRASAIDLDGLNANSYRYWVTQLGVIVWDSGVLSGPSANVQTAALDNGDYVAHFQIWSTLGASTAYPSTEKTLAFTIAIGQVGPPDNPDVTPVPDTPFYSIEACAPYVDDLDGGVGYLEIQRVDCPADPDLPSPAYSLAVLGPLETGECASWVDYTMPRGGIGRSCEYRPDECCSYYRARTVGLEGGDLRVSAWSDFFNPGVAAGVIALWPSTAASIPSGWSRVTALDGKYAKGIATSSTQPGTLGGTASHSHTTPGHTHDTSHVHTVTGATGNAGAGQVSTPGTAGTMGALTSHTHTRSAVNSATVASGSASPGTDTANNDPARLNVIFMQSSGAPTGVPNGALGFTADISLSGWADYANGANRFFKGAAAAGDGGATAASALASHTHTVATHTHTGTSHSHTSPNTGAFTSDRTFNSGPNPGLWQASHNHGVVVGNTVSAALNSNGSGASGGTSPAEPPYRNVRVKANTSGVPSLPVGLICGWRGALERIPDFWQLADGTNGTLNMTGVHPRGATASIGTTGGGDGAHTHTSAATHNHTTSGHTHTETVSSAATATLNISTTSTQTSSLSTHVHSAGDTDSTTPTVGNTAAGTLASQTTEPPYEEVAFIQLMSTPTPPPDPDTFCLSWDPDEHLIRTYGPDGPLWAPVLGKFEWTVERPFTAAVGVNGSRFVTSAPPGGRNLSMTAAVESEADLAELRAVLARPLVLISPSDAEEVWAAPVAESVKVFRIGRIRQITASFIGTGPQPEPQLADVGT